MKSFRSVAKNLTKRQFPWKKSDFQDLSANFPENEGLVDDSGWRLNPQTGKDPQMQTSAMDNDASISDEGAVFAESLLTKSFTAAVLKSVQLTVSKTSDAVILSTNSHTIGCACSVCALPPVEPELIQNEQQTLTASATTSTTASATLDLSKTFFLNSLAGARHTIYLDFDGHTTSGTGWNASYAGGANIVTPAFDFDGNPASFSSAELERIQYIWQRVAEDFSPFNVNVTTQAPTDINDLIKSSSSDTRWGVRVVIGGSSSSWFGSSAGGVAYRGSFNWNTDTPTYVFSDSLGDNEKYVAEAITHEVGHTLGLSHDGRTSPAEGYYRGHGSGQTGWAPIMGTGYYQNLTQWSKGEYGSANNTQDDLQIITTNNGFSYRADDTGNTIATAKALTISGTTLIGSGIIERNTDIDYYRFAASAGSITITVNPFTRGPNLDIWAGLYNSGGTLIASSNPTDLLSASITTSVAAGTYYLAIDGVGKGDPLSTGYTDYGSLGQYSIEIATNEILYGSADDDTLIGSADDSILMGGLGDDTYIVDTTTYTIIENAGEGIDTIESSVTFSLATLPNIENLTLIGTAAINGTGNAANNVITGNSANNILDGGAGNDTLIGGLGHDTYIVNSTTDTIIENPGEGTDTISSSVTFSLAALPNIEKLTLTGTSAINGTGNGANNTITGNNGNNRLDGGAGNDTLNGGAGIDTLIGGLGNDVYSVNTTTDTIIENAGEGTDRVSSSVTFSLAALPNIENLTLTGTTAINGTGNGADNIITGNSGNNSLDGGAGNDTLNGGTGNDTINGDAGNDILTGGTGKDTLTGGLGVDRFDYRKLADSLLSNFDVITDFNANAGNDLFFVSTARAGFYDGGTVATLDATDIAAQLTTANFAANFAALFTFGSRSFVAINNATAGFSATTDAIIEVTGFTGTLGIDNFTTTSV
ncbi:Ca2+-binding protein, RTX toxin [Nostoc sp. PCC 7524]|uniref:calcium-binding protein n=1 Tax=Nostoc sp. (strain ATCC 29411 / PCC 7524) TaxID=28072 RepID=UPI00029EDA9C|nr:calcium-binding protein [Nostoc sp. PCC 7524]AFY48314.1 Ca2+-binding protein, RTX toxin [Nostoc sp. PCC 7524]